MSLGGRNVCQNFEIYEMRLKKKIGFLGAFAKLRKATVSLILTFCLSARPRGKMWLPLGGFLRNLILEYFLKTFSRHFRFD